MESPLSEEWKHQIRSSVPHALAAVEPAMRRSVIPGAVAAAAVCSAIAVLGRADSGSAIAPINASSHVYWGERAGQVERFTLRQTLPGLAINVGASFWWALVFEMLFGRKLQNGESGAGVFKALSGGLATAGLAYLVDYKLVPQRLTPGWEQRISNRSLFISLGVMGIGLGVGALIGTRR